MSQRRTVTFAGSGGVSLVGSEAGEGPLVLLLHGGGQTRHSWDRTLDRLVTAGYQPLSLDQRGHGDSDWAPPGHYDFNSYRDDVRAVLAQLPERPAVVGASLGGVAGLLALAAEPDGGLGRARCLVLVDIVPGMNMAGVQRIHDFMASAPDGFASLDEAAEAIAGFRGGSRPRPASTRGLAKNLRLHADNRYRWHWDPNVLTGFSDTERERHRILSEAARLVAVPTLLVRGAQSDVVGDEGTRELAELIPQVQVANIAEAGHMVAGDSNDVFSEAIIAYVGAHATVG
jgi:pimeloyl-ACP methyl ester carboxylesterase